MLLPRLRATLLARETLLARFGSLLEHKLTLLSAPAGYGKTTLAGAWAAYYIWGTSMIIAPLLLATSTFFWQDGRYGLTGGALLVLSTVFWIPAFMGLFELLRDKMPHYATWGSLLAIYGCVSGALFGLRDQYAVTFNLPFAMELHALSAHPLAFGITLFWSGLDPCFL